MSETNALSNAETSAETNATPVSYEGIFIGLAELIAQVAVAVNTYTAEVLKSGKYYREMAYCNFIVADHRVATDESRTKHIGVRVNGEDMPPQWVEAICSIDEEYFQEKDSTLYELLSLYEDLTDSYNEAIERHNEIKFKREIT